MIRALPLYLSIVLNLPVIVNLHCSPYNVNYRFTTRNRDLCVILLLHIVCGWRVDLEPCDLHPAEQSASMESLQQFYKHAVCMSLKLHIGPDACIDKNNEVLVYQRNQIPVII
jgi:hypothetical protein